MPLTTRFFFGAGSAANRIGPFVLTANNGGFGGFHLAEIGRSVLRPYKVYLQRKNRDMVSTSRKTRWRRKVAATNPDRGR